MKADQQYLSSFSEVLLFMIGGTLFVLIALFTSRLLRPNRPNVEKLSTYESGEEPVTTAWTQFNIRFYIIALIFLLFEVEIIFLFPWSVILSEKNIMVQTNGSWGWLALSEAVIFILILALGLAYAWVNGHLDWVKPDPKPTAFQSPVPKDLYQNINKKFAEGKKPEANQSI